MVLCCFYTIPTSTKCSLSICLRGVESHAQATVISVVSMSGRRFLAQIAPFSFFSRINQIFIVLKTVLCLISRLFRR